MEGNEAIGILKEGNDAAIAALYKSNRPLFVNWFRKNGTTDDDQIGIWYQEAFLVFFEQVRTGKLLQLEVKVSTYLIGIGKNIRRSEAHSSWHMRVEKLGELDELPEETVKFWEEPDAETDKVARALGTLGQKCQDLLKMYYYRRFSMEAIAYRLGFKNEAVAKKQKYECLKKLRKNFANHE